MRDSTRGHQEMWSGYLSASSGVLRGTAGNELCVMVLEKIFIEGHMFLFCEDGIVGLDAIFLKESFISGRQVSCKIKSGIRCWRYVGGVVIPLALDILIGSSVSYRK